VILAGAGSSGFEGGASPLTHFFLRISRLWFGFCVFLGQCCESVCLSSLAPLAWYCELTSLSSLSPHAGRGLGRGGDSRFQIACYRGPLRW
jgi:hypothetical protein